MGLERVAGGASDGREFRWDNIELDTAKVESLREAGVVAGGAILGLGFALALGAILFPSGGVLVLDVAVLEGPLVPNCFVGDFVGDRRPLSILAPGVGLPPIALALLPEPFAASCLLSPFTALCTLLGLPRPKAPFVTAPSLALGFTSSSTRRTPAGRQNMPCPGSHSK